MSKFFEVTVKYQKNEGSEVGKFITEQYILDAVSFSDAETIINKEMENNFDDIFIVKNIKSSNISEITTNSEGEIYHKCKLTFIALDEEKGIENKHSTYILVLAKDVKEAYDILNIEMKDTVSSYSIDSVVSTKIVDYFKSQH